MAYEVLVLSLTSQYVGLRRPGTIGMQSAGAVTTARTTLVTRAPELSSSAPEIHKHNSQVNLSRSHTIITVTLGRHSQTILLLYCIISSLTKPFRYPGFPV